MNTLFPIFVKLDQINVLVVGAGPIGLEKLQAIMRNSPTANIHLVAEEPQADVLDFIQDKPSIHLSHRAFQESDLDGVGLVVLATNNAILNEEIRVLTAARHILLNVADKPALCDFYLSSVVQKGNLKMAISTNGKSPTIAKRLKEFLQDMLPEEIDETLSLMQEMRNQLKVDFQTKVKLLNEHTQELVAKK